jgi:hypothetical protein
LKQYCSQDKPIQLYFNGRQLRKVATVTATQKAETMLRRRRDWRRKERSTENMRRYISKIDILINVTMAK